MNIDWVNRAHALQPRVRDFVDGRWVSEVGGDLVQKYSPRDGQLLCEYGSGSERNVDDAVISAHRAFNDGRWCNLPLRQRKDALYRLAGLLEDRREELALLECLDVGKPITDALCFDVPLAVAYLRFYAEAIDKVHGKVYAADQSSLSYQLRRPAGVVAGIVGWNYPLLLAIQKIGPVLAAGNSLVLKPSEFTSLSAVRVAELALEAGIPEGVFNVVHGGPAVGSALALHRLVDLITFTGSTATGKKVMVAAGQSNMKRMILECGGKAPHIVFDDSSDLETIAESVASQAFRNQGEICSASSRLLIQRNVEREFLELLIEKAALWIPGDPLNTATRFGALVSQTHRQKVLGYIDAGKKEGAELAYRSTAPAPFEDGFYLGPVIFSNVSPKQKIAQEEIFGPVLSVMTFDDDEEAIGIANSTIYGLNATVWTTNLGRAHRMCHGIRAGAIAVNATVKPAGGAGIGVLTVGGHKESGLGGEGGLQGLEGYMTETAVQLFV